MDQNVHMAEMERALRRVQDRQDIYDCLVRYCRGIDRNDKALVMSAYHPDALDDHGAFCDKASEIVALALEFHNSQHLRTQHTITNISFDIDGDTANIESYWHYAGYAKVPTPPVVLMGGRYLDRFERRNGKWGIAQRLCVIDWHGMPGEQQPISEVETYNVGNPPSRDMRTDPSYKKPYTVNPKRLGHHASAHNFK